MGWGQGGHVTAAVLAVVDRHEGGWAGVGGARAKDIFQFPNYYQYSSLLFLFPLAMFFCWPPPLAGKWDGGGQNIWAAKSRKRPSRRRPRAAAAGCSARDVPRVDFGKSRDFVRNGAKVE